MCIVFLCFIAQVSLTFNVLVNFINSFVLLSMLPVDLSDVSVTELKSPRTNTLSTL